VALYQGVIGWDRGLEQLLAASALQNEVVLAIRGPGERLPALRQLAEAHRLEVLFLESVPSHQVVAGAAQADIGLIPFLPSCLNHYWSTPNKLFEYMMAGLPMAGSDIPELQSFVGEKGLGRLFDPYSPSDIAQCLLELGRDRPLLEVMGRQSRRLAEEVYCWERESQKLLSVYQDLSEPPLKAKSHVG
jgi:glycosyltransferase involved in cell wall biosynthesis